MSPDAFRAIYFHVILSQTLFYTRSDQTEPTLKGKSRAGNHDKEHDDVSVSPCLNFVALAPEHKCTTSVLGAFRPELLNVAMTKANNKRNPVTTGRPFLQMVSRPLLSLTAMRIAPYGSQYCVPEQWTARRLQRGKYSIRLLRLLKYPLCVDSR